MSGAKTRLLAVDLDGTLVDSAPDIAHCLGLALAAVGFEPPGEARTRGWIGDGLETLIARALAHAVQHERHPADAPHGGDTRRRRVLEVFLECYRDNLYVRSRLYPDVPETLATLRERGLDLCCITNKREAFSKRLLEQAGLLDAFELVLGGDSLAEKKPSPLQLNVAARELGVEPAAAALVGDSQQDLRAARSAGFKFVLAAYGYGTVDEAEAADAPRLRRFADLPTVLE